MKSTRMANKSERNQKKNQEITVEVLYQKMGDRWFAFSLIGEDVFVGSIPQSELNLSENVSEKKVIGNS